MVSLAQGVGAQSAEGVGEGLAVLGVPLGKLLVSYAGQEKQEGMWVCGARLGGGLGH